MTVINTNTASINAQYNLNKVNQEMEKAMEQLSSGKRINSAADDAAGLSISTRMESQIRGLNQAMRNAADGQSMVDTAEGAMDEISNMLQRMRELALQSSNGTNNLDDRANLNSEVVQLKTEIDRVVATTRFNDQTLLDGSLNLSLQIGAHSSETLEVDIANLSTSALGSVTGSASIGSVRNAEFTSVSEHKDTVVQLSFNGNDTFDFDLSIGATKLELTNMTVVDGSAEGVADAINKALTKSGLNDVAQAVFTGNVVTITNELGSDIKLEGFSADANTTAAYVSLSGHDPDTLGALEKLDAVTLGGKNSSIGTTFEIAKGDKFSESAVEAVKEVQKLDLSGKTFVADDTVTLTFGTGADAVELSHKVVTGSVALADIVTGLKADADYGGAPFEIAVDGTTATQVNVSFKEVGAIATVANMADDATVALDVDATEVTAGVDAVAAGSGGVTLNLDFVGADTYSFTLNSDSKEVSKFQLEYDGTEAGLTAIATVIGTKLGDGWNVAAVDGQVAVRRDSGAAFDLSAFSSEGGGRILASTDSASDTDGAAKLLETNVHVQAALTTGVGEATDTKVNITASSAKDNYSFTLSNGEATRARYC